QGLPHPLERRRPRHPHPERSQGGVREAAIAGKRPSTSFAVYQSLSKPRQLHSLRICRNHTPLHRQSMILERDLGLEISRATLDGWVLKVGELLIPMVAAMRRELISGSYIQADETPVDVQAREGRGKNHQAYLWQYGRPRGSVVFDFRLGRGRDGPRQFLGQFEGILQTDGYAAYDQIGGPKMVHAACWSHARRQFLEAVQLNPRDPVATPIVARMDELFAVDAEARRRVIGLTGRHALRQAI